MKLIIAILAYAIFCAGVGLKANDPVSVIGIGLLLAGWVANSKD